MYRLRAIGFLSLIYKEQFPHVISSVHGEDTTTSSCDVQMAGEASEIKDLMFNPWRRLG